ncbi:hypothetical protein K450DRAFT_237000 [Umbelopsis ramanniana AG]|uniref:Pkinase-domain-containing protein n=1 Tax=Umbelopsis ramanniana AG TaxID=1314678 RepID=A0AAD5EBI2_UMBRA|nr:uncharacterized protein K450DRAFT_237000 [Umbelopsis ramanniana AG]KAI8580434.1 hypothetical protein K450DRAFT_237000 [Umbelopsis ramanniana AG]
MYTPQQSHPPWINDSSQTSTLQHSTPPNSKLDRKRQAQQWIEKILGYHLPTDDLQYDLQDGVLLCQVLNKVRPGTIHNIGYKDHSFVKMENITNFLNGLRQIGLKNSELFQPNDLFESKDIMPVVNTVLALERAISTKSLPPASKKRLSQIPKSSFSKTTPFELYEDLTHPAPSLSHSSEMKLRSTLNHIPMAELSLNDSPLPSSATINPKYSRNKHHSELSYMTDMTPQAMRRKKSRSEIITDHKSSTRQKIPFHARYQEWSDQHKDKLSSSRVQHTLGYNDPMLDISGHDSYFTYEDELDEFGSMQSPNPFPSVSSPIPTVKDSSEKTNVFKSGSVGKHKEERQSNPFYNKPSESKRMTDSGKERLSIFDDAGDLIAQYQLGNCIGKGQYGSVYKALNLGTGQMMAVKRITLESANTKEIDEIMKEVELLKSLSHPNVVQYEGFSFSESHLNIILEYVENGSLHNTLQAFGAFPERLVASYCVRILQGLSYLHQNQVVHCDLKAANILTTKAGNVKLTDFGVSLNLKMKNVEDGVVAGTPNWMAPEIIELKGACFESDIWSLGCTIIELCTGKPPYAHLISMATLFRIVEDDCPPLPDNISEDLRHFLRLCFQKVPSDRPTPEELMGHTWIQNNVYMLPSDKPSDANQQRHQALKRHTTAPEGLLMQQKQLTNPDTLDNAKPSPYRQSNYSEGNLPALSAVDKALPEIPVSDHQAPSSRSVGYLVSKGAGGVTSRLFSRASKRFSKEIEYSEVHRFIKTSFSKSVVCKACLQLIKKHALFCEDCSLICHEKCKQDTSLCSIYVVGRPSLDEVSRGTTCHCDF